MGRIRHRLRAIPSTYQVSVNENVSIIDSNSPSIISGGSSNPYPNKPAALSSSSTLDFTQTPPNLTTNPNPNIDNPISGAPAGWNMIFYGNSWSKVTVSDHPLGRTSAWRGDWPAATGVGGTGGGRGIGNIFYTNLPNPTTRLYGSMRMKFSNNYQFHGISNKFVNVECNNSTLVLVQLKEGSWWNHGEQLDGAGSNSFFLDPDNQAGQIANTAISPVNSVHQFEFYIDKTGGIFKIWLDGNLVTSASGLNYSWTRIFGPGWNAFRGGGEEDGSVPAFEWYYYDAHIAW